MTENPPTFRVGQFVTWNHERRQSPDFNQVAAGLGDGPFEVVEIGDVQNQCNCGYEASQDLFREHHFMCGIYYLQAVGHPQIVTLNTAVGPYWVSGAWLEPI